MVGSDETPPVAFLGSRCCRSLHSFLTVQEIMDSAGERGGGAFALKALQMPFVCAAPGKPFAFAIVQLAFLEVLLHKTPVRAVRETQEQVMELMCWSCYLLEIGTFGLHAPGVHRLEGRVGERGAGRLQEVRNAQHLGSARRPTARTEKKKTTEGGFNCGPLLQPARHLLHLG